MELLIRNLFSVSFRVKVTAESFRRGRASVGGSPAHSRSTPVGGCSVPLLLRTMLAIGVSNRILKVRLCVCFLKRPCVEIVQEGLKEYLPCYKSGFILTIEVISFSTDSPSVCIYIYKYVELRYHYLDP